jgi:protein-L-isoaspartate(D-aspartate) O-methyltransferase
MSGFVTQNSYPNFIPDRGEKVWSDLHDPARIRLIMQLRQAGITDTNVLSAIERTPRDLFVARSFLDRAYEDQALPIGLGQTISQPFIVAYMTQALELDERMNVLELGTGSGYQAAVLAQLARRVYTIERHRPLMEKAEQHFAHLKLRNITTAVADGMKGWPFAAQDQTTDQLFDRIIVTASVQEDVPKALCDQLKIGGIMIVPVGAQGQNQILRRYKRESDDVFSKLDLLPVRFVPLLPDVPRANSYSQDDLADMEV